ncbi:MAG: exodeoxyribonuclease VII large subunit [Oscillospiraceae bacterium]|jgi:exodeoxyribonuclease VII large subunit|nr:exodeoxyribonuclease VII large subunit [Oscillospiraceae bacterium]
MISPMQPITITQLNRYARALLEENDQLRGVCVVGEISNFKPHGSGHWYLTLKDENAAVAAVMFRESNRRLGFLPENGMRVLARGRVSLYERDGKFQVYIDDMQPDGLGALMLAFEQLKERLAAEGLFAQEKKRALPQFPRRVGVITSQTGAAVQDILNILGRRYPAAQVLLCPVRVQGAGAAAQIAGAVAMFNERALADVLIVGRGGGSLEDLWAFNEEIVARAVAGSRIPVISAVGHETDTTICDYAADLRAPTPSAAAELAVPEQAQLLAWVTQTQLELRNDCARYLANMREKLELLTGRGVLRQPESLIFAARQRLDAAEQRIREAMKSGLFERQAALGRAAAQLDALSPLKVLARGYALALKQSKPVTSAAELNPGDQLILRFSSGSAQAIIWGIEE